MNIKVDGKTITTTDVEPESKELEIEDESLPTEIKTTTKKKESNIPLIQVEEVKTNIESVSKSLNERPIVELKEPVIEHIPEDNTIKELKEDIKNLDYEIRTIKGKIIKIEEILEDYLSVNKKEIEE